MTDKVATRPKKAVVRHRKNEDPFDISYEQVGFDTWGCDPFVTPKTQMGASADSALFAAGLLGKGSYMPLPSQKDGTAAAAALRRQIEEKEQMIAYQQRLLQVYETENVNLLNALGEIVDRLSRLEQAQAQQIGDEEPDAGYVFALSAAEFNEYQADWQDLDPYTPPAEEG